MNKKLILVLAIAMVLVSGAFLNSHAESATGPHFTVPSCWSFACGIASPHVASNTVSSVAPAQMGAVGY